MDAVIVTPFNSKNDNSLNVPLHAQVKIVNTDLKDWFLVEYEGKTGYVPSSSLSYNNHADTEDYYTVNFDFVAQETNQITCLKGDKVKLIKKVNSDWWVVQNNLGKRGEVPAQQLIHYKPPLEKRSSESKFKRAASKVLLKRQSIKNLSTPKNKNTIVQSAKDPTTKPASLATPTTTKRSKGNASPKPALSPSASSSGTRKNTSSDRPSRWRFVKKKIIKRDKSYSPAKSEKQSDTVKKTPAKPPRKAKQDEETTRSPAATRDTPRSDLSMNDSCVWDTYIPGPHNEELEDEKENIFVDLSMANQNIHPVYTAEYNVDEMSSSEKETLEKKESAEKETLEKKESGKEKRFGIECETGKMERKVKGTEVLCTEGEETRLTDVEKDIRFQHQISSTDSDLTSFSEIYDSLPDPPSGTLSSAAPSEVPLAISPIAGAGSTQTVVNISRDNISDIASSVFMDTTNNILTSEEIADVLNSTPLKYPELKREEEQCLDLDRTPEPPKTDISPLKDHIKKTPVRTESVRSDLSSAVSEAPSLSGTKSGIHYFSKADNTDQEIPDTPRLQHMIRSDPAFLEIVDADFFERSPQEKKTETKAQAEAGCNGAIETNMEISAVVAGDKTNENKTQKINKTETAASENNGAGKHEPTNTGKIEPSLGSDPKWDDVAKSVKERVRLMKEQELSDGKSKKKGRTWGKKRKSKKDIKCDDSSFVKRKEVDDGINSTMSSTATLTPVLPADTSLGDITEGVVNPLTPMPTTTDSSYFYTAREEHVISDDVTDHTTVSDNFTDTLPSLSGIQPPSEMSTPAPGDGGGVDSGTTPPPPPPSVTDELQDEHVAFNPMSIPNTTNRKGSITEPEILDLLTPVSDDKTAGCGRDPLEKGASNSGVIRQTVSMDTAVSSENIPRRNSTPGSSDTHVTQDTPSNDDQDTGGKSDSVKSLVTMETTAVRPHSLSLLLSDENVLDLSANNTLSFVYTQPPKQTFLSVEVSEQMELRACCTPSQTPDKDATDNRDDAALATPGQQDATDASPSGLKRKSDSSHKDEPDAAIDAASPNTSPEKLFPPPKVRRHSQSEVSPEEAAGEAAPVLLQSPPPDTTPCSPGADRELLSPNLPPPAHLAPPLPSTVEAVYQELQIPIEPQPLSSPLSAPPPLPAPQPPHQTPKLPVAGKPVVNAIRVLVDNDPPESGSSNHERPSKTKIKKQLSVRCDGRENLRVETSPHVIRRVPHLRDEDPTSVETDNGSHITAIRVGDGDSSHYRSTGGDTLSKVKVPYTKQLTYPPNNSNTNYAAVDDQIPPQSAPPIVRPSAPAVSPQPYFEGGGPAPPPLPQNYVEKKFGQQIYNPPTPFKNTGYSSNTPKSNCAETPFSQHSYHINSVYEKRAPQERLYPSLTPDEPQANLKLSGTSDSDEITTNPPMSCRADQCNKAIQFSSSSCSHCHGGNKRYHNIKKLIAYLKPKKTKDNIDAKNSERTPQKSKAKAPSPPPVTPKTYAPVTYDELTMEQSYTSHGAQNRPTEQAPAPRTTTNIELSRQSSRNPSTPAAVPPPHLQPAPPHGATPPTAQPTAPPHTTPELPSPTPSAPEEYEPETKPKATQQTEQLYPTVQPVTTIPSQMMVPTHQPVFGTPTLFPQPPTFGVANGPGMMPNVPFVWYMYGVPAGGQVPVPNGPQVVAPQPYKSQVPPPPRISKRKKQQENGEHHDCIDPKLLSRDLIRHVKRSCGLNSERSRTAARAILQCLEESISERVKVRFLSDVLTAMDTSYRAHRETETSLCKRSRVHSTEEDSPVLQHTCRSSLKKEKVLMVYLQHVLEILEAMSNEPDKDDSFNLYYDVANELLEAMSSKLQHKPSHLISPLH